MVRMKRMVDSFFLATSVELEYVIYLTPSAGPSLVSYVCS